MPKAEVAMSLVTDFNSGKKKKKSKKNSLDVGALDNTITELAGEKKKKKKKSKKNLLDVSALDNTMMELTGGKKKLLSHSSLNSALLDSAEEISGKAKGKPNPFVYAPERKKKVNGGLHDSFISELDHSQTEVGSQKVKRKSKDKSQHSLLSTPEGSRLNGKLQDSFLSELDNSQTDVGGSQKKKKKEKKRKLAVGEPLDETLEYKLEETPKKRKKTKDRKSALEDIDVEAAREPVKNLQKSPKIKSIDVMEGDSTPKSAKKRKSISDTEVIAVKSYIKSDIDDSDLKPSKSPHKNVKSPTKENTRMKHSSEEKHRLSSAEQGLKILKEESSDDLWSVEEELALIEQLLSHLNPEDVRPYKASLLKIDWKNLSISNHSSEECRNMLDKLISKITKFKTLTMILEEAKAKIQDGGSRLKGVMPAKKRFIREYCKKSKSTLSFTELRPEAAEAWLALSKEERKPYELEYEREVEKYKKMMDLPPDVPKTPFTIFCNYEKEKNQNLKGADLRKHCRTVFDEMKFKEKSKYILASLKEWATYIMEYESFRKSHPDWNKAMLKITNQELFKKYLDYVGMPKKIVSSVNMFREELKNKGELKNVEGKDKLQYVNAKFKELSVKERERYRQMQLNSLKSYESVFKAWKSSVDEAVVRVAETYFVKETKTLGAGLKVIEVSMTKPNFANTPVKPPSSPFRIFSIKFERRRSGKYKSKKEMREACSAAWKALSDESKLRYEERHKENKAIYKESLLEYVRNLGNDVNVFLGFQRNHFINYFREDIFENEFPNEEYPIFLIKPKVVGFLGQVMKVNDIKPLSPHKMVKVQDLSDNDRTSDEESDSSLDHITAKNQKLPVQGSDDESDSDIIQPATNYDMADDSEDEDNAADEEEEDDSDKNITIEEEEDEEENEEDEEENEGDDSDLDDDDDE